MEVMVYMTDVAKFIIKVFISLDKPRCKPAEYPKHKS